MSISDEDKALFNEAMKAVTPLRNKTRCEPHFITTKPIIRRKEPLQEAPETQYYLSNHYTEIVTPNTSLAYSNATIPHKQLRDFKNGLIRWDGRLDLHGLRPDDARYAVCRFIEDQQRMGHRCVLIIHGKGGRHDDEPILKNHLNHWLKQLPQILAFNSALPRDGGTGAVYVLLRRGGSS